MPVALVTDSTACLPTPVVESAGVLVVPLHVIGDGTQRLETDLLALPEDELVAWLRSVRKVGTSRPSPAAFLAAYEDAAARGFDSAVSVHLSGELSGTVDAAILAASRSPIPVEVVDTHQVGMAQGYALLAAAALAAGGAGASECAAAAAWRAREATVTFYVDTLDDLRRGGRIGAAAHLLGNALAIKPILTIESGAIVPLAKVRTAAKAIDRLVAESVTAVEAADSAAGADVAVHGLAAGDRVTAVVERLRAACPGTPVDAYPLSPVLGAHTGPGTLAVVVAPRHPSVDARP